MIKQKKQKPPATLKLFLDDVRQPSDKYYDGGTWLLCRDIESCKRFLKEGAVAIISLDGDMGKIGEKEIPGGVELCDWMRYTGHWPTESVLVHSDNGPKIKMMRIIIDEHFIPQSEIHDIEDPSKEPKR
jgi:hypothetical protein